MCIRDRLYRARPNRFLIVISAATQPPSLPKGQNWGKPLGSGAHAERHDELARYNEHGQFFAGRGNTLCVQWLAPGTDRRSYNGTNPRHGTVASPCPLTTL